MDLEGVYSSTGVDEVGRGSWAGPLLVVAARFLCCTPEGVRDSKLMTKKQRERVYENILHAYEFGEGWVSPSEIDFHGLSKALTIGATRALKAIDAEDEEEIILDGNVNYLPKKYKNTFTEVKGEYFVPTIAAASIYAKVKRDRHMEKIAHKYPAYYFDQNAGYGTKLHAHALKSYGPIRRLHRFSFSPVAKLKLKT